MPELPEVETVRRGLAPLLEQATLARVETRRADLRFPFPQDFAMRLEGQKIVRLQRRAKYLLAELSSGDVLLMHLGMTGRFTVVAGAKAGGTKIPAAQAGGVIGAYVYDTGADPAHDHVVFHLKGGHRVVYNDPRRFGFMLLVSGDTRNEHPLLRNLGVEPLDGALTADYLARRAAGKKVNLKAFLMDQRIIAGLGNIYASEALWRAGLKPDRPARTLADRNGRANTRAQAVAEAVQSVLRDAIRAGGSTLRDYRKADGDAGAFQETFAVYDREGEACTRPGCDGTIKREVHSGRATFFCPRCQR